MQLIGIAGRMHSGKSTLAKYIKKTIEEGGGMAELLYFSEPIKTTLYSILSLTHDLQNVSYWDYINSDEFKHITFSSGADVRKACQMLGDTLRKIEPLALLNNMSRELSDVPDWYTIIIPDVRRVEEVNFIHKQNGNAIYLTRRVNNDQHTTESELDSEQELFDFIINNQHITVSEKNEIARAWMLKNKYITGDLLK